MQKILFTVLLLLGISFAVDKTQAVSFAPNDPGVNIGINLDHGYEPSGIVWHKRLQSLFVIWDNGYITQMDVDGNIIHPSVFIGQGLDLEDITIVDEQSNFVYLLDEYPQRVLEFDISTWTLTGRIWNLRGLQGNPSDGVEALTYNKFTREFYVGSQLNGQIYIYNIDLSTPGNVNFSRTIATGIQNDIAGLNYSDETQHVYALFDSANIIQEYDTHDVRVAQFDVPGIEQEGLAILPGCPNASAQIVIAEDDGLNGADGRVMKYGTYPLSCIPSMTDNDRDGFMADVDCKDNDAVVNPGAIEILNDGKNNDCNSKTPDSVVTYDSRTLLHPFATEVRKDYQVYNNIGEYSYIRIPARFQDAWYSFELEAKANTIDQLYSIGVYAPLMRGVAAPVQSIAQSVWKTYTYTLFIPAHNAPLDIYFVSTVTGKFGLGEKREHHLRSVKVTRLEQAPNQVFIR